MANLEKNKLNGIYLSSFMSNSDQIVTYVEEVSADLIDKMNDLEPEIDLTNYLSKTEGNEISTGLNDRVTDIEGDYLSKTEGGEISGSVGIKNSQLNLLNSNYVQTNDLEHVVNYSSKNSFLQAEYVEDHTEYGVACTGSRGFCIISCMYETDTIKLSGDIKCLKDFVDANPDAVFSYALSSESDSSILSVSSIDVDKQTVTFKNDLLSSKFKPKFTEDFLIDMFYTDDNAFYCPQHPELGNIEIYSFYGNHAEGGATKAIGKYTHAEGRNTIADARYSHVEGDACKALGQASHAEGISSTAIGKYSHAEGYKTSAKGRNAHAEGKITFATDEASHAEGQGTQAIKIASHAEGRWTTASGYMSHTEGWGTEAAGHASHASGLKAHSKASDYASFVWQGYGKHNHYTASSKDNKFSDVATYESNGPGTFNINPAGGIDGFYIGDKSLVEHINIINIKTNYTAFEVCAHESDIPVGKSELLGGVVTEAIPGSRNCKFVIRSNSDNIDSSDIMIDWGDNNILPISKCKIISKNTEYVVSHDYLIDGKFTVKIYGKDYFNVCQVNGYTEWRNLYANNNLLCRVFEKDLPIASHIKNISSFARGSLHLLNVRSAIDLWNMQLVYVFTGCHNLLSALGFSISRDPYVTFKMFYDCPNLVETDFRLPTLIYSTESDIEATFQACKSLSIDINKLLPTVGFSSRIVNAEALFANCSKLYGTVPANILWEDTSKIWLNTNNCFNGCSKEIRAQVPTSWGGTNTEISI